jgi:hypothetical protein
MACLRSLICALFVNGLFCGAAGIVFADDSKTSPAVPANVDFATQIYPILRRSCFECHGEAKQEGDLRLDQRSAALQAGVLGAGKPAESELLRRVQLPRGHDEVMPLIGDPLSKREVTLLRRWIQQGAKWPEHIAAIKHWAYVVPKRPAAVESSDWGKSPIDGFVLKRLRDEGLNPSPQADPETLIRRLSLDLIGLPPTPAEVDAFLTDTSDKGIERVVEDLLQRPQFGERWARPWLDLARYADSHGFQRDDFRDVWAYRDWVIRALNADMPFDQFTVEQIAGDLLPNATESQKVATGFHRCTPTNCEAGSLPEETRIEQVIDRVNTTGAVWLGTTLECAQCHDHKYDPVSTKDYYRLLAYYNNTELEADRKSASPSSIAFQGPYLPLANSTRDKQRSVLQSQLAALKKRDVEHRQVLSETLSDWVAELRKSSAEAPRTHVLDVSHFESLGTDDTFEKLDDGSVLLTGDNPPENDVYTVTTAASLKRIRAIRLDVLKHELLPGGGPGRGDSVRRNFILNEFSAHVNSGDDSEPVKLNFREAQASFSQAKWGVAGAIDGDPKTGWAIAPEFEKDHFAVFLLNTPLNIEESETLTFTLSQHYGDSRTIGRLRISAMTGNVDPAKPQEEIPHLVEVSPEKWSTADRKSLLNYRMKSDAEALKLIRQMTALEKQIAAVKPDTTLVMIEVDAPRLAYIFERGDYRKPGEAVVPGTPEFLHPLPEGPPDRTTLARWLVDPQNPLVARVTVNRWWAELFGRGIVATVEDFGLKGDEPSHPEVLDWLAAEFVEHGWSMKHILKTIVLSATYQQSSHTTRQLLEQDDLNRLLARGPRFRMDAEMIRDNALAISGLLSLKQFGPPIRPFQPDGIWNKVGGQAYKYHLSDEQDRYRRGLYVVIKRGAPYPSFVNFDASARLACTVKRSKTNTPLQALTLLNDPVYVEAAQHLAKRVLKETEGDNDEARLDYAFRLATGRRPTGSELSTLLRLVHRADADPDDKLDHWYDVATVLLNLHATITKD